jgi:hypothetical protein
MRAGRDTSTENLAIMTIYLAWMSVQTIFIIPGLFLALLQIDHRHPEVQEDFLAWGAWVLEVSAAIVFVVI